MKVYVVYLNFPRHVFLEEDLAKQYIKAVNTSPYKEDTYRIMEMEISDELFKNFKIITKYWFRYEMRHNKSISFYLMMREENNLDNNLDELNEEVNYEEILYHNSEKPRVRSIVGSFYIEKRESEIEYEMFKEKFRSKCNDLMEEIIQFRTDEQWSIEEINEWLPKEPFVIK